jgi:hypothetical protein
MLQSLMRDAMDIADEFEILPELTPVDSRDHSEEGDQPSYDQSRLSFTAL